MPALVAIQHEPNVRAFYRKLIAAGKRPMQAVVAVMRKLLHAIWGMLKHDRTSTATRAEGNERRYPAPRGRRDAARAGRPC